jgi:hypothetical protein
MEKKTKKCKSCEKDKELTEYHKYKRNKDGLKNKCKDCIKQIRKEYYKNNKEKIKEYQNNNKEKIKEYHKKYKQENKLKIKNKRKIYLEKNKEKIKKQTKIYRENNKDRRKEYDKIYYIKNIEKIKTNVKNYRKNNKDKRNERNRYRYKNDDEYKNKIQIRTLINKFLKNKESSKVERIIGCSYSFFYDWIEYNCILDNLDILNIHIDHVYPLSKYNNNNWNNLYPLIPEDNLKKSNNEPSEEYVEKVKRRERDFLRINLFN